MEPMQCVECRRRANKDRDTSRGPSVCKTVADLPSPESIILAWGLWLPDGTDIAAAARREVARIERKAPLCPNLVQLRNLFLETIAATDLHGHPGSFS